MKLRRKQYIFAKAITLILLRIIIVHSEEACPREGWTKSVENEININKLITDRYPASPGGSCEIFISEVTATSFVIKSDNTRFFINGNALYHAARVLPRRF